MENFFEELFGLKPKKTRLPGSENDKVEDGFLVVGETSGERTTLNPGQGTHLDRPPSYNNAQVQPQYHNPFRTQQAQQNAHSMTTTHTSAYIDYMNTPASCPSLPIGGATALPSYSQAQSMPSWRTNLERQQSVDNSDGAQSSGTIPNFQQTHDFDGVIPSCIAGVPFKLSPVLENNLCLSNIGVGAVICRPNMRDFDYDFTLEVQILKECGLSELDLDNLKIQSSVHQSFKKKYGHSSRTHSQELLPKYSRQDSDVDIISF